MSDCSNKYDVAIIGAGISGIVCGCYLAKAGIKTLIVEKNEKPGGCCVSFIRNGFKFDACGHSLGGLSKSNILGKILDELEIRDNILIDRYDPADIIIMPDRKFYFCNKVDKTIKGFRAAFPEEKGRIISFFNFINNSNVADLIQLKDINFGVFLNQYFSDAKLKVVLSIPILVNLGMPAYSVSAFTAVKLYKQYILDNGYYPSGGIEEFSFLLANKFKELGGQLHLSRLVTKIEIRKNVATGIYLKNKFIEAKYIISNIDARQTFLNLLDKNLLNARLLKKLDTLRPSISMYILYLGLKGDASKYLAKGITHWIINDYDIDGIFNEISADEKEKISWYAIRLLPDQKSIIAFTSAPFKDENYWITNKSTWMADFIKKIEQTIPQLSKYILHKEAATPQTLYRYTLNYRGARCGWASIPSQLALSDFSQKTFIDNLYLTGHWTTLTLGIPGVAYIGKDTARIILKREGKDA